MFDFITNRNYMVDMETITLIKSKFHYPHPTLQIYPILDINPTIKDYESHIEKDHTIDSIFDIYIIDVNNWRLVDIPCNNFSPKDSIIRSDILN